MRILYKVLALLGAGGQEESGVFKKKSTETVLKEIYEAYPDAFADGRRLSGLFADFSGGQLRAQKNQLDIFLKCGGNTRILALRDEAPRIQQREYHRLVGEMMDAYSMQQERALEISSIFWKTALGTQAPAMGGQEKKEKPAKKPSEKQPGAQRIKGLLMLFWIYLLDVGAKVFYMLPRELSRIEEAFLRSQFYGLWSLVSRVEIFVPPLMITDTSSTSAVIGVIACWLYTIVWHVRFRKSLDIGDTMWHVWQ